MPAYSKLTKAQLQELCDQRDINHDGLRKPQLIEVLRDYDCAPVAGKRKKM